MLFSMPDADSDEEMASETSSFIICQKCGERLRPAMTRCRNCGSVIPRILSSAQSNKPAARQPGFNPEDSFVEDVLKQAPSLDETPCRPVLASFRDFLVGLLPDALVGILWPASGTGKVAVSLIFTGLVAGLLLFQFNGNSSNGATATSPGLMRGGLSSIAFSPDGTELAATRSYGMVEIWDTAEGTIKTEANLGICTGVVFHKDPGELILAQGPSLKIWNSQTEKTPTRSFKKHDKQIFFLDSSADRRLLFTRSLEGILTIWNTEDLQPVNSKPIRLPQVRGAPFSISQDGKWFARGGQKGEVFLLQLPDVKLAGTFKVSLSSISSIAFSPDNQKMAVGTSSGRIAIYDLGSKRKEIEIEG